MANILITGANRGIGLELCRQFAQKGNKVFAVCRQPSAELLSTNATIISDVDVTHPQGIDRLSSAIKQQSIDVLVNNAGVLISDSIDTLEIDSLNQQFLVNAVGPLLVTKAVMPCLSTGSKIAIVTSRMGSVADNTSGGQYGYRMSKAAVNIAGASLARDLKPKGIAVALLHPGYVQTDMTHGNGNIDAKTSAASLIERINGLTIENSGTFWHANGEQLPW